MPDDGPFFLFSEMAEHHRHHADVMEKGGTCFVMAVESISNRHSIYVDGIFAEIIVPLIRCFLRFLCLSCIIVY